MSLSICRIFPWRVRCCCCFFSNSIVFYRTPYRVRRHVKKGETHTRTHSGRKLNEAAEKKKRECGRNEGKKACNSINKTAKFSWLNKIHVHKCKRSMNAYTAFAPDNNMPDFALFRCASFGAVNLLLNGIYLWGAAKKGKKMKWFLAGDCAAWQRYDYQWLHE